MAIPTAVAVQVGFAAETLYGSAATPDHFLPVLLPEGIKQLIDRMESKAIRANRLVEDSLDWAPGEVRTEGPLNFELYNRTATLLMVHALGSVATVSNGAGVYSHTITPGDLTGKSLAVQVGRATSAGVVTPFTYCGTKIKKWTLTAKANELVKMSVELFGRNEVTTVPLAGATYQASLKPYTFVQAALTIAGSTITNCREWMLTGSNALEAARYSVGSAWMTEPSDADHRQYTGSITMEYDGTTQYARFTAGTEFAIVLTCTSGTDIMRFTLNCRFDGETPTVSGPGNNLINLPFKCIGSTDAAAITAMIQNADVTP